MSCNGFRANQFGCSISCRNPLFLPGLAAYLSAKRSVTRAAHENLEAIARLKADEIERWLEGHGKDVRMAIDEPLFTAELQQWLKGGRRDNRARQRLLDRLRAMSVAGNYRDVASLGYALPVAGTN